MFSIVLYILYYLFLLFYIKNVVNVVIRYVSIKKPFIYAGLWGTTKLLQIDYNYYKFDYKI